MPAASDSRTFGPGDPVTIRAVFRGGTRYTVTLRDSPSLDAAPRLEEMRRSLDTWVVLDLAHSSEKEDDVREPWSAQIESHGKQFTALWCRIVGPHGGTGWYRYGGSKIRDPRPLQGR